MSVALARPMPIDTSPGEIGGVFAGVVAILYAIGKGIKWAVGWNDARTASKAAQLEAWEAKLARREEAFEAQIEARMTAMERENRGLRLAFQHVSARLHHLAPDDPALALAERILAQAIPLEPFIPPDMADKLGEME